MNSTSWRLEQLQTRARIQASQSRFWLKNACLLWAVCTVIVFLLSCGRGERKSHMVIWLLSSVTPARTVGWQGERYKARELSTWLSGTVYHGTPGEWLVWSLLLGLLPVGALGGIGCWYIKKKEPGERYIRGTELLSKEELQQRLRKGPMGIQVAGVTIPHELERSHFLICGATGSGKTVTIRQLLRQIAARGESAIIVDPDGEFTQEFYDPAREDFLLNPLDARCPEWTPWAECENGPDIEAQAASLFPITPELNEAATYYHNLARLAYGKILEKLPTHDPRRIPSLLGESDTLTKLIGAHVKGVETTLQIACASFRHLQPGVRPWSAREWVRTPQGWCFLTFRETDKAAVLPLLALWLESVTRRLLDRTLAPEKTIWVVIDELAVIQAQPTLVQLINRGRKRGVAVVVGFQDVLQLHAIYGKELASNMLDQPSTRLLLRTNNGETQRWCSGDIGRREVERPMESETVGPENLRDAISRSHQRREEPAVMGSQFGGLPNLSGYLKVAHYGAARVHMPYVGMVERQPAFVARTPVLVQQTESKAAQRMVSQKRRVV